MILDDNGDMLLSHIENLKAHYTIYTVKKGDDALQIIEKNMVELIVIDATKPGSAGFQFCKCIKTHIDYSHISVILLTDQVDLNSKIASLEVGADAFIEKPFSPKHLQVQVSNLLSNRKRIKVHLNWFSELPFGLALGIGDKKFHLVTNRIISNSGESRS